jgi:hypothetical protein
VTNQAFGYYHACGGLIRDDEIMVDEYSGRRVFGSTTFRCTLKTQRLKAFFISKKIFFLEDAHLRVGQKDVSQFIFTTCFNPELGSPQLLLKYISYIPN